MDSDPEPMDWESSDSSENTSQRTSIESMDEIDFEQIVNIFLEKILEIYGLPDVINQVNSAQIYGQRFHVSQQNISQIADRIIKLMGWFFETKWMWDSSNTLTMFDADVDGNDLINTKNGHLSTVFSQLLKNQYQTSIENQIRKYFKIPQK